jgi:hypothetical protein
MHWCKVLWLCTLSLGIISAIEFSLGIGNNNMICCWAATSVFTWITDYAVWFLALATTSSIIYLITWTFALLIKWVKDFWCWAFTVNESIWNLLIWASATTITVTNSLTWANACTCTTVIRNKWGWASALTTDVFLIAWTFTVTETIM